MAWINRQEQNTLCEALETHMAVLQQRAQQATRTGDLPGIARLAQEYAEAEALERRLYSYQKDR